MAQERSARLDVPRFDRQFFDGRERFTAIGSGSCGGKAAGLLRMRDSLESLDAARFPGIDIVIPTLTVITTELFDRFVASNDLAGLARSDAPDAHIALAFQQADLPVELLGDLRALVRQVHSPLAIRSSSLLEDALYRPFAGVYETKMIPNNQPDPDVRFRKLVEAIKFVYASTFFADAKRYIRATEHAVEDEKMAVIIQEVVGRRHRERFYPEVAGVARSYSFYRFGGARPEEGVLSLALGLGKTIVDEGVAWNVSPAHPKASPPFASIDELLDQGQTAFWAVNMGQPPAYDPIAETEYLVKATLEDAEADGALRHVASTFDRPIGPPVAGHRRARAAAAELRAAPRAGRVAARRRRAASCSPRRSARSARWWRSSSPRRSSDGPDPRLRLGFLQVRPMVVSSAVVDLADAELRGPRRAGRLERGDGQRRRDRPGRRRLREAGALRGAAHAGDCRRARRAQHRARGRGPALPAHRLRPVGQLGPLARHPGRRGARSRARAPSSRPRSPR